MSDLLVTPAVRPRLWVAGPVDEILAAAATGLVEAVVTNPDVLASWREADGVPPERTAARIAGDTGLPVFLQLRGPDRESFLRQAAAIRALDPRLLPKIPATAEGFSAAAALRDAPVLITAVATLAQAAAAAAAGARFLCPYFARMRDLGMDPARLCFEASRLSAAMELVPASLRTVDDFELALRSGSTGGIVFTGLFREMLEHDNVLRAMDGFEPAWTKCSGSILCT
ncbi:hypothetical protein OKA05_12615 [Luteolibacter arcticus]|uniref:Transaldolase n=1 Tax=Luteolibacter arcticus TaxID=1581411 RepID=A0ABT3GIR0_9BACT|nr:transaldolase family protein [Luteolibacter arcticus]MCW1923400.1 hypothetical protein [Luteolibacter arcticus]